MEKIRLSCEARMTWVGNRVFLAAPFFNKAQNELLDVIETFFDEVGVGYFSARRHAADVSKNQGDAAVAFKQDITNLNRCTVMLAVVDWAMPEGEHIARCKEEPESGTPMAIPPPLNIPDAGTCFEMGHFYAQRKPILLYTVSPDRPINVMLRQCCVGVVRGLSGLHDWFTDNVAENPGTFKEVI